MKRMIYAHLTAVLQFPEDNDEEIVRNKVREALKSMLPEKVDIVIVSKFNPKFLQLSDEELTQELLRRKLITIS